MEGVVGRWRWDNCTLMGKDEFWQGITFNVHWFLSYHI